MPNYCNYEMQINGKETDVDALIAIMQESDYDNKPHLYRVFEVDVMDDGEAHGPEDIAKIVVGHCAWSVHTCMMEGDGTYLGRGESDPNGTSLIEQSKRLNLTIEYFSGEPGVGFEEHVIINNGTTTTDDVVDMVEYFVEDFEDVDTFNKEADTDIDADTFETESFIRVGGFDSWAFTI